jgi:dTDP-4-amino-4,6-dideoxygalactose transaminase
MQKSRIWLSAPHMGETEQKKIAEAFQTNWIAPLGPNVDQFEEMIRKAVSIEQALVVSSGTAALHLALILLNVQADDYVFCQSFTFSASANPIAYLGARPVFIDSEKDTWNMDPLLLEQALFDFDKKGKLPKAIILVDLYGMPARLEEIASIASQFGVPIIEDAAEALGSKKGSAYCGTFGSLGIFSFNGNKIITTSGGGALVGRSFELIQRGKYLATQARQNVPHYEHTDIGYNYRMSNVLAGIGIGQMEVLTQRVLARRANFEKYRTYFKSWNEKGFQVEFQQESDGAYSNRWLTTIVIDPRFNDNFKVESIYQGLLEENIESRPLWKPMHLQPVFKNDLVYATGVSEYLFNHGLCMPSGSGLTDNDFSRIFETLDRIIKQH